MTHQTPTPHDAEEAMRPYLGKILDAEEAIFNHERGARMRYINALDDALQKALELLGVQR